MDLPKRQRLSSAKEKREKKVKVPEKFIKHIVSLGFQESDGAVLYRNKSDWMGLSTG